MGLGDALPRLQGKLPDGIMNLAQSAATGKTEGLSEAALAKALKYFNQMMVDAWTELDHASISCKEFVESNRETFGQVRTDLEHLAAELGDQDRLRITALGMMQDQGAKIKESQDMRTNLERQYMQSKLQSKGGSDEVAAEMAHSEDVHREEIEGINEQMAIFRQTKQKAQELFAEATSSIQTLRTETQEKEMESRDLESAYDTKVHQCKSRIQEILYTNICAVRVVRDSLMSHSEVSPPSEIGDCDFTDWAVGPCSADCDDSCPTKLKGTDPYACGGSQKLTRDMVGAPNKYGMACPALAMLKKCNQIRCPVNCKVSEWSGFSKCSADCGGGQQQRTRSILVKPRHGGAECDSALEERPCNTGSCNRDCTLDEWTEWAGCSAACGGGVRNRVRDVLTPIRALGKCPAKDHPDRLEEQQCNTQSCHGDEVCIARQDLVVAIDASGSEEPGFERIRALAANLTGRYRSRYYGQDRMKVGVLVFGQGKLMNGGYLSAAEVLTPLSFDLASVVHKIEGMQWQRGIANMLQALSLADKMLESGRRNAQSAILVITDGTYTSNRHTSEMVQHLKDKNIHMYMAPISEVEESDDLQVLKTWASQPWELNYERIPGHDILHNNHDDFAQMLLSKFCPESFSPSAQRSSDTANGFALVRRGGYPSTSCAAWTQMPNRYVSPESCYHEVRSLHDGSGAFTYMTGSSRLEGTCYTSKFPVTAEIWQVVITNATDLACPGGEWKESPYADTYILSPDGEVSLA